MSFQRYPSYKDSGVEWLGEVPEHWEVRRLGFECDALVPMRDKPESLDGEIPWVRIEDFAGKFISDSKSGQGVSPETVDAMNLKVLPAGAVLCSCSCSMGATAIVSKPLVTNQTFIGIVPKQNLTSDYLYFFFHFAADHLNSIGTGAIQSYLSRDDFRRLRLPGPSLAEQTAIAGFLDRETGKIDELVAEQRRLMELLKEKRQAVISHAVTRGLNPAAPFKPSGIEWLGDVPATWEAPSLGVLILKAELGENHDSSEGNEGVPVMKMGNLDRGFIKLDKVEYLPEETEVSDSVILRDGDFLFNTRNSLDLVGKVAIWRGELPRATYNSNVLRISFNPLKVASREFMNYLFNSDLGLSQLRALAKGTTSVAAIYYKDLTSLRVMLPPAAEQHAIAKYLDDACAQLDTLTGEAQRAIDLLQERRTALISAAVTGQIDVRQLADKKAA